jgi:hypothetical protein
LREKPSRQPEDCCQNQQDANHECHVSV